MPRKSKKPAIIEALSQKGADPIKVADSFGVQRSYVYHLDKKRREGFGFAHDLSSPVSNEFHRPQGEMFTQMSPTSLRRYGGDIGEEYLRELQGYNGTQVYKEMGNHPIVAAVLQAIKMTIRRVQWYAKAPKSGREEEVDFIDSCMNDMDHTFSDFIDESLSMLQYGYAPLEKVCKKRNGMDVRPGPRTVESRFKDGKIGWRKFQLIAPDTLAPGNSWIFDNETGDLVGLNQLPPPGTIILGLKQIPISIPIEKVVLFRTTKFKDSPEGVSICRPMYRPYWYATNLEEVEAIAYERSGAGFPVFYLGDDISKGRTADAEILEYRKIGRNIRIDEQMSLVIPHPKMGPGMAREGQGVLFEFATPQNPAANFNVVIERHEKRMAMVGLAQFIHLGMGQYGAQSLAEVTTDFFQLAVSAWADSIRDTINRSAVIPLLKMNRMDVEDPVIIEHGSIGSPDLKVIADYVNKVVGAKVIEPDDQLESEVRRLAGFPEKDPSTTRDVMTELNGDGGIRKSRSEKTDSREGAAGNQRNMNPKAKSAKKAGNPSIEKPRRT